MSRLSRITLAESLAAELRREILAGAWTDCLPGYRVLGRRYSVSQPTCETALRILAAEGLVSPGGPRRPWTVKADRGLDRRSGTSPTGTVLWLGEEDETRMNLILPTLTVLRRECEETGGRLILHIGKCVNSSSPKATATRLLRRYQPDRVILHNAPARTVAAFHSSGLPVFMLGGERPAELQVEGMGFYFANILPRLVAAGKRRLLVPLSAGLEKSRTVLTESMVRGGLVAAGKAKVWVPAIPNDFPEAMTDFWRKQLSKVRPDAILSFKATWVVPLYCVAWELGLRPGRDFVVVTTDSQELLRWFDPAPLLLRFSSRQVENLTLRWLRNPDPSRGFTFIKPRLPRKIG